jgi:hypothetical protein
MIVNIISNFLINLFSCFSKKKTKYSISSNGRDVIFEDLETTYLFESDDNINY